jgi:NAD(P)-dependent dehydrogenase (short-subunit alcohol dehydrogenase family)
VDSPSNYHSFNQYVLSQKIADAQIINMLDKNIARYDTEYFYYLLTKKFLAEFTKMLSLQLAPNIRVNGIAPGLILKDKDKSEDNNQKIIDKIPLKRKGNPENIIQTLDFLINNNFVNGQIISIDGGASLNHAG